MDIQILIAITSLITSIGTIAAVVVALVALKADHERRKKQATIEYYNDISNNMTIPLRMAIKNTFGEAEYIISQPINSNDDKWKSNSTLQEKFIYYCRNMERFSVGILNSIYDFETFDRCAGNSTVKLYRQIEFLIHKQRRDSNNKSFCKDFEILYNKLCSKHNLLVDDRGEIIYS